MEEIKRPKPKETDEDLLKQQELFFEEKCKPSVQIVQKSTDNVSIHVKNISNELSQSKQETTLNSKNEVPVEDQLNIQHISDNTDIQPRDVVFDVKENFVSTSEPFTFKFPSTVSLPEVNDVISNKLKTSKFAAKKKAKSIFAQMLEDGGEIETFSRQNADSEVSCGVLIDGSGLPSEMKEMELKKIHEENLAKLSSMSKDEILQHQEQLKSHLDPQIINFIKSKRICKGAVPAGGQRKNSINDKYIPCNNFTSKTELPGEVLKNEGRKECDALLLEKALQCEASEKEESNLNRIQDTSRNEDIELPEDAKKLVEGCEKGYWRNMNKIEKEKLKWMTDLPQPKPVNLKTGYTARFDFEGKLLSHDVDVPIYKGLHHHGDEPEVAGYSLEELFLLARSSLQSQRITALHTLAHILENNWYGMMDSCFDSPLLPMMLNGGIVPLLRWALDDTSLTSIAATVTAIHSLLISKADEVCLQRTFCWLNGHIMPQLEPQGLEEPNIAIEELTDADLIKLDVVKGFLRIDILLRFKYVLQVMCPPPLVCQLIIEICTRLAQHSTDSATQVATHPGLMKLLFEKFLPFNWQFVDAKKLTDSVNYCCPMHCTMKLVRVIASSSKELALHLMENYDLLSNIIFYLTVQPIDGKLPPQDVQFLIVETLKTWQVLLCYGQGFKVVLDLFPVFLKQLDFCLALDLTLDEHKHLQDFEYAIHFFKALEAVTAIAGEQDNRDASATAVNVLLKKALVCLKKWLWQFSQEKPHILGMTLLASCMNFVSAFYLKSHKGLICEDWEHCSPARDIYEKQLVPCIKSKMFHSLLSDINSFSLLLDSAEFGNKRDGQTIVSLGSILWRGDVVPPLKEGTPFPLLSAFFNYIIVYKSLFAHSGNEILESLLSNCAVSEYLKEISSENLNISSWFVRFETYLIYQLLQLSSFVNCHDPLFWHGTAISLLPILAAPQESLVEELFLNIIFNETLISKIAPILQVDVCHGCESYSDKQILQITKTRLPVIAKCYFASFLDTKAVINSRNLLLKSTDVETLSSLSSHKKLIPNDWCYMPVSNMYEKCKTRKCDVQLGPEDTLLVTSSLQWIHLCHFAKLPVIKSIPASVEFCYLCMVFLVDEDLFWDEKVKLLLERVLFLILKNKKMNLKKVSYSDITGFDDLFLAMLNQFEAVSYGDHLFGSYILLPLQQRYPSRWKSLLLTEYSSILKFLGVPLSKLFVPLQNYLQPVEKDPKVLSKYFKALLSGALIDKRCPLLYAVAVHHIHHFLLIRSEEHLNLQRSLLSNLMKSRKKDLQRNILLYSTINEDELFSISLNQELSADDQEHLNKVFGSTVNL